MRDLLTEAWRGLWNHRLRTGLTMLGIGWGLFAEMMMLSLGVGLYTTMHNEFAVTGAERINFHPGDYQVNEQGPPRIKRVRIEPEDVEALRTHATLIRGVVPEHRVGMQPVRLGDRSVQADVYGIDPAVASIRNFGVQYGRMISRADVARRRLVCTIGAIPARRLGLAGPMAIGKRVVIRGVPLTIIGLMTGHGDQLDRMHSADDEQLYVPISTAARYFLGGRADYWTLYFESKEIERYREAIDEVKAIVGARQHYDASLKRTAWINTIFEQMQMIYFMTLGLKLFLGVAGAVTVFVGGVGVMNIMSVAIAERTNEIGLRKALGATPRQIFIQFFLEAFMLTIVAAGVAFAAGMAIIWAGSLVTLPRFVPAPMMSAGLAVFLFSLTVVVGVFAGTRPALRAARLQPASALRQA